MDLLTDLLAYATGDAPGGAQRAQAILAKLRELAGADIDLGELERAASEQFSALYKDGEYDPGDADTLQALPDVRDAALGLQAERDAEKAARDAAMAALADRIRTVPAEPAADQEPPPVEPTAPPATAEPQAAAPPSDPQVIPQAGDGAGGDAAPPPADPPAAAAAEPPPAPPDTAPPPAPPQAAVPIAAAPAPAPPPARRPSTAVAVQQARTTPTAPAAAGTRPLRSFVIAASAEIPEYPMGQHLTIGQLAEASAARFATLPVGQPATAPIKANVARIHRRFDPSIALTGNHSDIEVIDRVADEKRLPGGSLAAAVQQKIGGLTAAAQAPSTIQDVWCTPSETDYRLCEPLATRDGLLDLPTTGMPSRGGIRYPMWNQYPEQQKDVARNSWHGHVVPYPETPAGDPGTPGTGLDNPGYFHRNNPEGNPPPAVPSGPGYPKKCIEGPCVNWKEHRQSLAYLCITSNVLQDRTFPEGIARFTSDVFIHHAHFLNETYINYIEGHSDKITPFSVQNGAGSIGSTSLTVVDRLALLVTWFRNRYKMAMSATLEIVAPEWFKEYLKRDIEKKNNRPFGAVSDAEIAILFAQYTSRVQWIRDWQEIGDDPTPGNFTQGIMPPAGWPPAVKMLAYPAGSWVLSEGNILQFGVQYDYQLLQENKYSAYWTEDTWMLVNRCNRTFVVELNELCANGAIGPFRDVCPTPTPGESNTTPLITKAWEAPPPPAEGGSSGMSSPSGATEGGGDTPPAAGRGKK